ncbi:MAG: Maf family protein [Anaerolineales bacterium]
MASSSPRRRELLALGKVAFDVLQVQVDEKPRHDETPRDCVHRLAADKGNAAIARVSDRTAIVISADSTIALDGAIISKPSGAAEATSILRSLRGRTHLAYSGVALTKVSDGSRLTDVAITEVPMRNYSDSEIKDYVESGDPLDKAGAYAIQNAEFHPVESMSGCMANVVGLPLCHLQRNLRKLGAGFENDIAAECQSHLRYECPVTEKILAWKL